MNHIEQNLYSAAQTRELDRTAIEDYDIPGSTLMARAADAAFKILSKTWPQTKNLTIVCGVGNNAGDGFVLARIACSMRLHATVLLVGDSAVLRDDALEAYEALDTRKVIIKNFSVKDLENADLIVDAIFGSGLSREVSGNYYKAIEAMNKAGKPILALDIPSGLCADTGNPLGIAVKANRTVSFVGKKRGLYTNDGPDYTGKIYFDSLKIPKEAYKKISSAITLMNLDELKELIPPRLKNSHKGKFGHVLVVGGNLGMAGAAVIASTAALRTGAGLVSLATHLTHTASISSVRPEIMAFVAENEKSFSDKIKQATVIAIGPGLGQTKWAKSLLEKAFKLDAPLVADADALNLLSKKPVPRQNWILTPHPSEAARLLDVNTSIIQQDRFAAVRAIAKKYRAVVVLKGCGTLVCSEKSEIYVCPYGNPLMASGGMGDALTGIIAAMVAQGLSLLDAAKLGTCLHGAAGDLAAKEIKRGLMASDLIECLTRV